MEEQKKKPDIAGGDPHWGRGQKSLLLPDTATYFFFFFFFYLSCFCGDIFRSAGLYGN